MLLLLIFVPLERIFALRPQKIFRPGWLTDFAYYLTGNLFGKLGILFCSSTIMSILGKFVNQDVQERVAQQPIVAQLFVAIIIADLGYYSAHRLLHSNRWLWHFHAIHHSIKDMDWLAAVRVHPMDQLLAKMLQVVPLYWLGFSTETLILYFGFSAAIAFFIHSNIQLKAGIFKWLIATPEFHHWHHANMPGVRNCNMAAQLPVIDLIFGTLYMPQNSMPTAYGISDPVPSSYHRQLVYPFQKIFIMLRKTTMNKPNLHSLLARLKRPLPMFMCAALLVVSSTAIIDKTYHIGIRRTIVSALLERDVNKVSPDDLVAQKVKSIVWIDVRSPEEHQHEQIGQSYLVPIDDIEKGNGAEKIRQIAQQSTTKTTKPTLVLYCGTGPRSVRAYRVLHDANPDLNMVILSGGIMGWRKTVAANQEAAILSAITLPHQTQPIATHK
ncbi:MAG: sterol desaturase family protein [Synechococcales bacterium]|nr:sterol desaturase family protein [Synechococcales bacterium]